MSVHQPTDSELLPGREEVGLVSTAESRGDILKSNCSQRYGSPEGPIESTRPRFYCKSHLNRCLSSWLQNWLENKVFPRWVPYFLSITENMWHKNVVFYFLPHMKNKSLLKKKIFCFSNITHLFCFNPEFIFLRFQMFVINWRVEQNAKCFLKYVISAVTLIKNVFQMFCEFGSAVSGADPDPLEESTPRATPGSALIRRDDSVTSGMFFFLQCRVVSRWVGPRCAAAVN